MQKKKLMAVKWKCELIIRNESVRKERHVDQVKSLIGDMDDRQVMWLGVNREGGLKETEEHIMVARYTYQTKITSKAKTPVVSPLCTKCRQANMRLSNT